MSTETLVAKYQALSPNAQKQVQALIEALAAAAEAKPKSQDRKRFTFNWEGGLRDLRDLFTSVELQHHINELR